MHEIYSARKHPEFVVLELDQRVGALILHTGPEMHGIEVEISPEGDEARRSHKEVLERSINGRPAFTAVFDRLEAGAYTLWTDGVARVRGVSVAAGEVAELRWSDALAASAR
jgi:hypothetical protein